MGISGKRNRIFDKYAKRGLTAGSSGRSEAGDSQWAIHSGRSEAGDRKRAIGSGPIQTKPASAG
ncbi:hypothetical protein QUB63_07535 [Microcoleus sp. ARI1-B5]|uniref:hypothetical protein n=1 Tax=unclassified Microcoleus TaxID=2642155 RepID=UPI002FCFC078